MKINLRQRFKNKTFVVSLATLLLATVYQILGMFDVVPKVSEDTLTGILMLVVNFLSALGILVDPTTEGLSDSKRALTYGTENDVRQYEETGGYVAGMLFSGRNRVTQPYTYNVNTKKGHGGIDIVGDDDRTVHAVEGGTVSMVSVWDGKTKTGTQSYGNLVVITDSTGKRHFYAHLASIYMSKGQRVSAGDVVGIMGQYRQQLRRTHSLRGSHRAGHGYAHKSCRVLRRSERQRYICKQCVCVTCSVTQRHSLHNDVQDVICPKRSVCKVSPGRTVFKGRNILCRGSTGQLVST